ncbi:MAG: efflux RND transporter permease subunit [Betaproteobacteria bacterium]|nr:efflux RND transporter permease subunit [Betaproteobacteria bacterium]MDE2622751.1 efflux RND transporter permease subunit [Betaproteobacteria bacterium]
MWIVRIALQRPYTFIVMAVLIVLLGLFSIRKTPTDIFPNIRIPVVAVVWRYDGLQPQDMANNIVSFSERVATTTVNDIEHVESQSLYGIAVVKYFFQPNVNEEMAVAQITSISQTLLRTMPPGTMPPFILAYNASSVPVLQLALSSSKLSESQLFDFGNNFIRTQLATVAGASLPWPYGGKQRQIQVDLNPVALRTYGLSAQDVTNAIGSQNLIIPAGTQKIGDLEYYVKLNASFGSVAELNDIPIRTSKGGVVYVRDVAHVRDGSPPQTNIVRVNGSRAALMSVLKTGNASTLNIIDSIKEMLPSIRVDMPPSMSIEPLGDQSIFVRAAVNGVIREGVVAAALTGLMILLFLGSWRSTLIITISIPLSILASIICLSWLGETINIMTLGGLALAVGILVDDATVTIENINWHLEQGKDIEPAILDGAHQIAMPALVSTLCICIVFIPMFLLTGVAHFLFVPLAEAVVFAMLASYVLSRTLVPTLAKYWLRAHSPQAVDARRNALQRFQAAFERGFHTLRDRYHELLEMALHHRKVFAGGFMGLVLLSGLLVPWLGEDFFPSVDAGQIKLHLRARTGTRIEETAALCDAVERSIRESIPKSELDSLVDIIGLPYSGINLSYSTSAPIGPSDADIFISLKHGHKPSDFYVKRLRRQLADQFPSTSFSFLPADIVNQILNFGLPSPLDVQIIGNNLQGNRVYANELLARLRHVPGAADMHIQQAFDYPQINVDVNRSNAKLLGYTQQDVASNLLISLSGSFQTNPTFWVNPKNGVEYNVAAQAPQYRMRTLQDLATTPISTPGNPQPQILANLANFHRSVGPGVVTHYNVKRVIDIFGSVHDSDLGSVAAEVRRVVAETAAHLPKGSKVVIRGQVETMQTSFSGLEFGLLGAVILVYLLIVVNFQSWLDPFIIITALPGALAGIVWMLFLTHTTLSVPALTGAIMSIGVATANSILIVSFARERMNAGLHASAAALEAAYTRFRPVLMTALAMIIGMLPMALGLGEGGEQNAPLGRAVIGGLLFATVATLFFVPVVFSLIHGRNPSLTTQDPN